MKFVILSLFMLQSCRIYVAEEVEESFPRVITPLGTIEGYYKTSSNGRKFEAYEGVPYGQPPIGEYRFQVARKVLPWKEVLMAKEFSSSCLQYSLNPGRKPTVNVTGSEDCLYMNIYTTTASGDDGRNKPRSNLLPVIFFIHGGFFQFGSGGEYGPKYLLDREVTLVTVNYRLGPLGFLSTEDQLVPGNLGLKDQVLALQWIQDNIRSFGGDPSRVTIVGHSAGGVSVHYHLLSKLSSGLFQRGMSVSGTALNCWAQTEGSLEKAKRLATIVGCPSHSNQDMINCLKTRPADQITRATEEFMPFLFNPPTPFGPVVEKGDGDFAFIDRPPIETITSGRSSQDVPWITSGVSAEGLSTVADYVSRDNLLDELDKNWERFAPFVLDFNYTIPKEDHTAVARAIREHYLGKSPINRSVANQIIKMVGDRIFLYDGERAARLQARVNKSPVQYYYFTYRGAHSFSEARTKSDENFGVSHGDDIAYVLDSFFDPTTTPEDRAMQEVMINIWVSFAKDGVPDTGVEWSRLGPSRTSEFRYLHIAGPEQMGMEKASNFGDKNFWRTIGFRENIVGQST